MIFISKLLRAGDQLVQLFICLVIPLLCGGELFLCLVHQRGQKLGVELALTADDFDRFRLQIVVFLLLGFHRLQRLIRFCAGKVNVFLMLCGDQILFRHGLDLAENIADHLIHDGIQPIHKKYQKELYIRSKRLQFQGFAPGNETELLI